MFYVCDLIRLVAKASFLLLPTSSTPAFLVSNKILRCLQKCLCHSQGTSLQVVSFSHSQMPLLAPATPIGLQPRAAVGAKDNKAFPSQKWVVLLSEALRPQKHLGITVCSLTAFSYMFPRTWHIRSLK